MNPAKIYRKWLLVRRIFIYTAAKLQEETYNYMPEITFKTKDFFQHFWLKPRYGDMERAIQKLSDVYIPILDIATHQEREVRLYSKILYMKGSGEVRLCFSDELYPYIVRNLDSYGLILVLWVETEDGTLAWRPEIVEFHTESRSMLYLLLAAHRWYLEYSLQELRSILWLDHMYEKYSHLKTQLLTPTQQTCRDNEDIDIEFTFQELPERPWNQKGKKVTGVRFSISTKENKKRSYSL